MNKTPKEEWLAEYPKELTRFHYNRNFELFCAWAKTSDVELVKEYEASKNKKRWRKETGATIVRYYSYLLSEKGYASNTARSMLSGIRAFLSSQCETPKIRRGAIAKPKIALGEHEFTAVELRKMFFYADTREKAILSTAIALGWGAQDFIALRREFIEPYLEKEAFVGFWYERKKTGATVRGHLTPESIESLTQWLAISGKSEWVWASNGDKHITDDTLNNIFKEIVRKANIKTTGKVRFHATRKFLLSQLLNAGVAQAHAKLMVGKMVPPDLLAYLTKVTEQLREEYIEAYPRFALVGYTTKNHDRVEQLEKENRFMKMLLRSLIDEKKLNDALETVKNLIKDKDAFMQFRKSMIKDRDQA